MCTGCSAFTSHSVLSLSLSVYTRDLFVVHGLSPAKNDRHVAGKQLGSVARVVAGFTSGAGV